MCRLEDGSLANTYKAHGRVLAIRALGETLNPRPFSGLGFFFEGLGVKGLGGSGEDLEILVTRCRDADCFSDHARAPSSKLQAQSTPALNLNGPKPYTQKHTEIPKRGLLPLPRPRLPPRAQLVAEKGASDFDLGSRV